jgi:hypothetical protein
LYYAYVPYVARDVEQQPWTQASFERWTDEGDAPDESALIELGIRTLRETFADPGEGPHVVFLSGGLDSRGILCGLLEAGLKDQIVAVTYGTPGTLDYEIGRAVAQRTGVRHEAIDLTQVPLTQELLDKAAVQLGQWLWLFDVLYIRMCYWRYGKEATYWSGHLGGTYGGDGHLYPENSDSWEMAVSRFAASDRNRVVRSVDLYPPDFDPKSVLPQVPVLEHTWLNYDEQIDFLFRQHASATQLLLPKGYRSRQPYMSHAWAHFMLKVPRRYLEDHYLYKKILKQAYPDLYSLPTKNLLGLPLGAPRWRYHLRRAVSFSRVTARRLVPGARWPTLPGENYIDFDRALRSREDIKMLVHENIQALHRRGIIDWIDITSPWDDHQRGRANHGYALTLLASLEVCLRMGIPPTPDRAVTVH